MLQPLFEPQGLARYLRPPPARVRLADPEGIDPEVPDDEGGDASWAMSSDEDVLQALRMALKEEDSLSGEEDWDKPPREIPRHHLLLRLRGLFRRIPPTVKARLDRANPEDAPASATVALLGASLDMEGAALRVLDFLDAFLASPNLGLLLRHLGDRSSVAVNYRRLAHMLNLREAELRRALGQGRPLAYPGSGGDLHHPQRPGGLPPPRRSPERGPGGGAGGCRGPADTADRTGTRGGLALGRLPPTWRPPSAWRARPWRRPSPTGPPGSTPLLYGPPGTGKTELARALAADRGLRAYQVRSADDDGDGLNRNGRLSAYLLAQRLLGRRGAALLIFDEVEDVFDANDNLFALLRGASVTGRQKGWMNRILEENPVPAIWIANHTGGMDPAFLRRFLLPVACGTPPRSVRRQMAEHHLGDRGLAPALLDDLADDQALAPAQLGAARRLLELCPTTAPERAVREGIGALRTLLHGAPAPRRRSAATPLRRRLPQPGG
jgi:transitional endoplasmic reticulum ATPase